MALFDTDSTNDDEYIGSDAATRALSVTAVERLCDTAVALRGTLMRNMKLEFYAGQYVNLTVPDTAPSTGCCAIASCSLGSKRSPLGT